jgi:hypothetical protein
MSNGAVIAAAAAAEKRRKDEQEEEMTTYSQDELEKGWEFKIVRANTAAFGKPAGLKKLIDEEARAGWVMVEKFDNYRIRFKRPASACQNDPQLPAEVDPYRTQYGMSPTLYVVLILGIVLGSVCLVTTVMLAVFGVLGSLISRVPVLVP